ncbi:MAG TPA: glycosyltransferase family 2 protein [Deltaproteobacteria bacterium]|nr:glycosyltransferase family 2 protein [Deltaproteobacteria bacterium]
MNGSSLLKNTALPVVSVIVPAYNHENYISDCLCSIMDQNYPNIDLIVLNDGSTDRTDQKIRKILEKHPSGFRYISHANQGLIKTLNRGLQLSRGKYFCEVASDDMLLPESIKKRLDFLEADPAFDVVFADRYRLDGVHRTKIRSSKGKESSYRSPQYTLENVIEGIARIQFATGMFKKSFLDRLGGFDEDFHFYEDIAMQYQLAIHAKIGYLDEPVMYHRKHSDNTSMNRYWVRKEKMLALEKLLSLENEELSKLIKKNIYKECVKFIKFAVGHSVDREETARVFRKAVEIEPYAVRMRYYMTCLRIKEYM